MSYAASKIGRLPLMIPQSYQTKGIDFSDVSFNFINTINNHIEVETEEGTFDPLKDFKRLFRRKYNFCFWYNGEIDYALNFLNRDQRMEIEIFGKTHVHGTPFLWPNPSLSIKWGNGTNTKYLINLKHWVRRDWVPQSLNDIKMVGEKLQDLQEFIHLSPLSLPLTTANFLTTMVPEEFEWVKRFSDKRYADILKNYHEAYPARLEYSTLGSLSNVKNVDQVKAHLSKFMDVPSLSQENIMETIEGSPYLLPEAHPGSIYLIRTNIPEDLKFGPIPSMGVWPVGSIEQSDPVSKKFLETLDEASIPYEILWSYQILIKDFDKKPFKELAVHLWYVEEYCKEKLFPLQLKNLHYTMCGHPLHIREELDPLDETPMYLRTSSDYNPMLSVSVKGNVLCETWKASEKDPSVIALREDAVTGTKLTQADGFKEESIGDMYVLCPNVRDKPGEDTFRHLSNKMRDWPFLILNKMTRNNIHNQSFKLPLGAKKKDSQSIAPNPYLRPKGKGKLLGDFLEGSFYSEPPRIKEVLPGMMGTEANNLAKGVGNQWLEDFLLQIGKA